MHLQPQLRRGHRIRQCAVEAAVVVNVGVVQQGLQLVVGRQWIYPFGQLHGAGKVGRTGQLGLTAFGGEEGFVEAGVVGYQRGGTDELKQLLHDLLGGRGGSQHGIGDTGEAFYFLRYAATRVHQALKLVRDLAVHDPDGGDFGGTGASVWREPCGFEVDHDHGFGHGVTSERM